MPRVLTAEMFNNRYVKVYKIQSMPCLCDIRIIEKRWDDVYLAQYFKGPWKGAYFFVRE